eukprot:UC4_evm2s108
MVTETIAKKKLKGDQAFADDFDLIKRLDSVIASSSDDNAGTDFTRAGMMINYATVQYTMRCDHLEKAIKKFDIDSDLPDRKENDGTAGKSSRRATNKDGADFIIKDIEKINDYKPELEFREDPLFNQTSAKFDEGGPKGLLLNHIPVDISSHLVFDSSRPSNMMTPDANTRDNQKDSMDDISDSAMNNLQSMLNARHSSSIEELEIFPAIESAKLLGDFIFCGWQPDTLSPEDGTQNNNSMDLGASSPVYNDLNDEDDAFDLGDNTQWEGDFDLDLTQVPENALQTKAAQYEPTMKSEFSPSGANSLELMNEGASTRVLRTRGPAIKIKWDGSSVKGIINESKKKKERKKKEPFSLDFFSEFDRKKAFARASKKQITLPQDNHAKNCNQNLLPEDIQFSVEELSVPFTKKGFRIRPCNTISNNDPGQQRSLEDTGNYICQISPEDGSDSYNDSVELGAPDFAMADDDDEEYAERDDTYASAEKISPYNTTFIEDSAPLFSKVSKTRKDVNVRLVKKQIWQELTSPADENSFPGESPCVVKETSVQGVHSFSGICSELPGKVRQAAKNGNEMAKNLSIPVNFVILLHLANEHQLSIESLQDNLGDLAIKGN